MNWQDIIAALSANTQRAPIAQRQQAPPVIGPGGVTSPSFIPPEAMQGFRPAPPQQANPELFRGPLHASPLRIEQTASRMPAPALIDAYTQAPTGRFAPPDAAPEAPEDDNAAWLAARARVQQMLTQERQNAGARIPRPGAPLIGQAWAAPNARKNMLPDRIPTMPYQNPTMPTGDGRWFRRGGS